MPAMPCYATAAMSDATPFPDRTARDAERRFSIRPVRIRVTRDSVSNADDVESHERVIELAEAKSLEAVVRAVLSSYALPKIAGGRATWCLGSRKPFLVVAQQWPKPKLVWRWPRRSLTDCTIVGGALRLHFSYFAQLDPNVVLDVLNHLWLEV